MRAGISRRGVSLVLGAMVASAMAIWGIGLYRREPPESAGRHEGLGATSAAGVRFEDVTRSVGVDLRHVRASTGRKYFVETMGPGCAVFDYDRDGWMDLFLVNGAPLPGFRASGPILPKLYRNRQGHGFTDVTRGSGLDVQAYGMGCAVGDYDNDGWDDLYLTAVLGPSRLFRNRGEGKFQDVTTAAGVDNHRRFGTSAAWLDYDRDGDLDLYVCNYVRYNSVADDLPCHFKAGVRSYCIPFAYKPDPSTLYRNEGGGRFTDVSHAAGIDAIPGKSLGVAVTDYNKDGWPDIFIANDTTPTQLFLNNKNGTFSEEAAAAGIAYGPSGAAKAGMGIDVADDRNDGNVSVAMGNFSAEMVGYYQYQDGFFEERSTAAGLGETSRHSLTFGTLFLDANNDGWRDLFLANGHVQDNVELFHSDITYEQRPLLFANLGNAKYKRVPPGPGSPLDAPIVARGAARADFENDGLVDLVVTRNNGPGGVWRNTTEAPGHWLMIRLHGKKSNRNGYGARLILTASGMRQTIEHASGSSYLSASDQRVHFGLGNAVRAERIEVHWPSGTVDVLTGVPADQIVELQEGSGEFGKGAQGR